MKIDIESLYYYTVSHFQYEITTKKSQPFRSCNLVKHKNINIAKVHLDMLTWQASLAHSKHIGIKMYTEVPRAYEHVKCICLVRVKQAYAIVQATVQLVVLLHVIGFVADGDKEDNQMQL
jgi:hypothetical protein